MLLPSVLDGILARFQGDRRHPVHRGLEQNFRQGSANTNVGMTSDPSMCSSSRSISTEFHAGRFLALVENDYPYQVSLPQLETLRRYNCTPRFVFVGVWPLLMYVSLQMMAR
jgi:hypothetical protein